MSGSDKTAVETGGQQTSSGGAVKFNLRTTGIVAAGNSFFLGYHQPFQIMGNALTKSNAWSGRHVSLAGLLNAVAVIIGINVSSVYWRAMGLMPG